jgi:hypothetical protein
MVLAKNQTWDQYGNLLYEEIVETTYPPLDGYQIVATLNAVLGIWTLEDAANVAGVNADHLISEAQAWSVAAQISDTHNSDESEI